jgi:hypothetical protein
MGRLRAFPVQRTVDRRSSPAYYLGYPSPMPTPFSSHSRPWPTVPTAHGSLLPATGPSTVISTWTATETQPRTAATCSWPLRTCCTWPHLRLPHASLNLLVLDDTRGGATSESESAAHSRTHIHAGTSTMWTCTFQVSTLGGFAVAVGCDVIAAQAWPHSLHSLQVAPPPSHPPALCWLSVTAKVTAMSTTGHIPFGTTSTPPTTTRPPCPSIWWSAPRAAVRAQCALTRRC